MKAEPQPARSLERLAWLDTIKGLAILGILIYHAATLLFGPPPFDHPKDDWLSLDERLAQLGQVPQDAPGGESVLVVLQSLSWLGYQGVHLFLVLSGFGLTWSLVRRSPSDDVSTSVNLRRFYWRRLGRVFPLYWAAHLFFLLFHALVGKPEISLLDWRFYPSLVGVRFLAETFFYVAPAWWYVGIIVQLYLVFPALWIWLRKKGLRHFWLGTLAITLVSRFVFLVVVGSNREMWSMGAFFVTRLFEFTFGMGLAYWLAEQPDGLERLWQKRWPLAVAILTYLAALALSFTVAGAIVAHSLIAVSLFGMTYAFSQHALLAMERLGPAIGWLGKQSYSLMILHQPFLWWFIPEYKTRLPQPIFLALLAGLLILVILWSAVFGALVERVSGWVAWKKSALGPLSTSKRRV